jgi:methyl-accepting chemotaxis protein
MKLLQHKLVQRGLWILAATAGGTCLAYLCGLMGAGPVTAAVPAALGGAALAWWAARQDHDEGGVRHFAHTVGEEIDAIMIGAAETSYFVDSVKKKIELDVGTAGNIVHSSSQNADTTERIAANAERAARSPPRCAAKPWPAAPRPTAACSASAPRARMRKPPPP